jgi:hypothetical protein
VLRVASRGIVSGKSLASASEAGARVAAAGERTLAGTDKVAGHSHRFRSTISGAAVGTVVAVRTVVPRLRSRTCPRHRICRRAVVRSFRSALRAAGGRGRGAWKRLPVRLAHGARWGAVSGPAGSGRHTRRRRSCCYCCCSATCGPTCPRSIAGARHLAREELRVLNTAWPGSKRVPSPRPAPRWGG